MSARLIALVPAAGRGERFGGERSKMFVLLEGRTILEWTVARLLEAGAERITVALPPAVLRQAADRGTPDPRIAFVAGGDSRQASVAACLRATPGDDSDLVMVHDGARPAFRLADITRTVEAARETGAAILGRPVADTLKRIEGERVTGTVDRARLFRAETPQVFRRELLERAFRSADTDGFLGTDEASLVERLADVEVRAVAAKAPNPKLTNPGDLELIRQLLAGKEG